MPGFKQQQAAHNLSTWVPGTHVPDSWILPGPTLTVVDIQGVKSTGRQSVSYLSLSLQINKINVQKFLNKADILFLKVPQMLGQLSDVFWIVQLDGS